MRAIQYSTRVSDGAERPPAYWIIRWSLSSGGVLAPTRWRMMTAMDLIFKQQRFKPSLRAFSEAIHRHDNQVIGHSTALWFETRGVAALLTMRVCRSSS